MEPCRRIRPLLADVVDKHASASTERRVAKHIEACSDCARELESIRTFLDATNECFEFPDQPYPFDVLAARLGEVRPVSALRRFLPQTRIYEVVPRAVAAACMFVAAAASYAVGSVPRSRVQHARTTVAQHSDVLAGLSKDETFEATLRTLSGADREQA